MALDDYGALLRSGAAAVPNYAEDQDRQMLRSIQRQALQQQVAKAQEQLQSRQRFDTDLAEVLADPTPQGYARLIARNPDFADQAKKSWELMDEGRRKADFQSGAEVYSAANAGKYDLAAQLLERRMQADIAAGEAEDPMDRNILDALKSGDQVQQKAAMGMIGVMLSASAGPDKFGATLGDLTKGTKPDLRENNGVVWDANTGNVVGQLPGGDVKVVPGVGVTRVGIDGVPMLGLDGPVTTSPTAPTTAAAAPASREAPKLAPLDLKAASSIGGRFGTVTSTTRSAERNRKVGGVPNSWHIKGRAIDIARKPGVNHGDIVAAYQQAGYQIIEQLDEGDHSHLAFAAGPSQTGGPQPIRSKQQYDRLPSGAQYIAPDGTVRTKS